MSERMLEAESGLRDRIRSNRAVNLLLVLMAVLFGLISVANADEKGDEIVGEIRSNLAGLNTLIADITLSIDVDFIDIPPKKAKMYYKSPGRTYMDIPGFSMLPKVGQGLFIDQILNTEAITTIYAGETKLNGRPHSIIKVLPIASSSEIVLSTLWIAKGSNTVSKAEVTTKNSGSFEVSIKNIKVKGYYLPETVDVSFKVPDYKIPKSMTGDTGRRSKKDDNEKDKKSNKEGSDKGGIAKGSARLVYSNYQINLPISEDLMKD